MKTLTKAIFLAVLTVFPVSVFSQKAETVRSFAWVLKDLDWYKQQAELWKIEIDKKTANAEAWVNFYRANKAVQNNFKIDVEKRNEEYLLPLNQIIEMAEKAIPNTFELNFIKADCLYDKESLLQAQKMRPFDPLLFSNLMTYYMVINDKKNVQAVSRKWFESNDISTDFFATTYNLLMSLDDNAIIIVWGDCDTYPIWILQNALNIRTDVTAININLLGMNDHQKWFFKENAIAEITLKINDTGKTLANHIVKNVKTRPVYFSSFANNEIYADFTDKLYLTGLALKYSEKPFDNIAVLKNNIENKFLIDHLKISFQNTESESMVAKMNLAYMAPFLKLYEHYRLLNEKIKMEKIKNSAKIISEKAGVPEWMQYFE